MASVFSDKSDQTRMERTLVSIEEIRSAILGTTSERVRGDVRFSGYVQDMGDLPELVQGQPKGLWKKDLDADGEADLVGREAYSPNDLAGPKPAPLGMVEAVFLGWNGPYLKQPAGDVLKDGWGNSFVFERDGKDFIIKSPGADGKTGGKGHDDIVLIIMENDWLAPVAGYMSPYIIYDLSRHSKEDVRIDPEMAPVQGKPEVVAHIYYAPKPGYQPDVRRVGYGRGSSAGGTLAVWDVTHGTYEKRLEVNEDGYFCFDGDKKIPVGERLLAITHPVLKKGERIVVSQPHRIYVEPGVNWLGNMGCCP